MKVSKRAFFCLLLCCLLLFCSVFSVGAERIIADEYTNLSTYTSLTVNSGGAATTSGTGRFPVEGSVYRSSGPLYFTVNFADIVVPKGYYAVFEVRSYSTYYPTVNSSPVQVSKSVRQQYLVGQFLYTGQPQLSKQNDPSDDSNGVCYSTFIVQNDTEDSVTISAFNFGYKDAVFNSSDYRVWLKLDYIHYRVMSAAQYQQKIDQINSDKVADKIDEQTEKQKGFFANLLDGITSGLNNLLDGILDGIKSLFVPGDVTDPETGEKVSYFTQYFDEWNDWLDEHLGVLYFPFKILFDVLDKILTFSPSSSPTITFPGLTIMGQKLLDPIEYNMATYPIPWLQTAHEWYLFAVDAIIGLWLVRLAYKKLNEIMGGGGD